MIGEGRYREVRGMMCEVCGETLFGADFCPGCGVPVSNDAEPPSDDDDQLDSDEEFQEEINESA